MMKLQLAWIPSRVYKPREVTGRSSRGGLAAIRAQLSFAPSQTNQCARTLTKECGYHILHNPPSHRLTVEIRSSGTTEVYKTKSFRCQNSDTCLCRPQDGLAPPTHRSSSAKRRGSEGPSKTSRVDLLARYGDALAWPPQDQLAENVHITELEHYPPAW
jgi:hypothetical protein